MNNDQFQSSQDQAPPVQQSAAPQSFGGQSDLPGSNMTQPPKKNVGKIVGIVAGVVALVLLVVAVILYFVWWQNPQKVVTDSVVNLFHTEKTIVTGKITASSPDMKMDIDIKSNNNVKDADAEVNINIKPKGFTSDLKLKLNGVYGEDGSAYVKADGLRKAAEAAIEMYISQYATQSEGAGSEVTPDMIAQAKAQMMQMFNPFIDKVEGKWLKFSASELSESEESKCVLDTMKEIKSNKQYQKELSDVYRANQFIVIKDVPVPAKNGATGFEIDIDNAESKAKAKEFSKAVEQTEFAKKLKACDKNSSTQKDEDDTKDETDKESTTKTTLRIWVDSWSHQLKSVEVKSTDEKDKSDMTAVFDLQPGQSNPAQIPTDARSAKEVMEEIKKSFGGLYNSQSTEVETSGIEI